MLERIEQGDVVKIKLGLDAATVEEAVRSGNDGESTYVVHYPGARLSSVAEEQIYTAKDAYENPVDAEGVSDRLRLRLLVAKRRRHGLACWHNSQF